MGWKKTQSKVDLRRVKENGGIKATLDLDRGSQATTVRCSQGSGCVWELLGNVESKSLFGYFPVVLYNLLSVLEVHASASVGLILVWG